MLSRTTLSLSLYSSVRTVNQRTQSAIDRIQELVRKAQDLKNAKAAAVVKVKVTVSAPPDEMSADFTSMAVDGNAILLDKIAAGVGMTAEDLVRTALKRRIAERNADPAEIVASGGSRSIINQSSSGPDGQSSTSTLVRVTNDTPQELALRKALDHIGVISVHDGAVTVEVRSDLNALAQKDMQVGLRPFFFATAKRCWTGAAVDPSSFTDAKGNINASAMCDVFVDYANTVAHDANGLTGGLQLAGLSDFQADGGSRNDTIVGWSNLTARGGDGDDVINGQNNVLADGGAGNDLITGNYGLVANGGSGDDCLSGYDYSVLSGGTGNDYLNAYSHANLDGGDGNDLMTATYDSVLDGGAGDDAIEAGHNSVVRGGSGNDIVLIHGRATIDGGSGNDTISTGDGSDVTGGEGDDSMSVGAGSIVHYSRGDGTDRVQASGGQVTIMLGDISIREVKLAVEGDNIRVSLSDGGGLLLAGAAKSNAPELRFKDGVIDAAALKAGEIRV